MTARRPRHPSIVLLTLAVAALAVLPAAAAVPVAPQPSTARADAVPRAAGGVGVQSMRFNPVAFRFTGAPITSPAPAAVAAAVAAQPLITTTAAPGTAAARAIEFALAQRGLPYVWGGNGPQQGDAGFDCSGLTTAAYAYAGIRLPRTAHTQYYAGPHVPDGAPLEPGDLVFYGVPARVHHVGLYLGEGRMVNAPTFGKPVRLAYVRYPGDDYLGATRPAAGIDAPASGLLATPDLPVEVPPVPSPAVPPGPEEFVNPEVPASELPPPPPVAPPTVFADALGPTGGVALGEGAPRGADPTGTGRTAGGGPTPPSGPTPPAGPTPPGDATPPSGPTPSGTTPPPETPAPSDPTPPPVTTSPPTPTPPAAPPARAPETTPTTAPAPPAASAEAAPAEPAPARPVSLTLPGSADVALAAAERGPDGLPVAPTSAGTGGLRWSPAEGERTARATVALHPGSDVSGLATGATVTVRGADGTTELTIRSRATLDAAGAADRAAGRGESLRLVLLRTDPATGEVLVVIAE